MFNELNRSKGPSSKQRQPVALLLGGGMAAGKSTVREIIGQDDFWTKVTTKGWCLHGWGMCRQQLSLHLLRLYTLAWSPSSSPAGMRPQRHCLMLPGPRAATDQLALM